MTEVHVEHQPLDAGVPVVLRDYGRHVRLAFDPAQIEEGQALVAAVAALPRLAGAMKVVYRHRADA
ncbi:hypothetical protein [Streptomyces sp. WMMC897]|uniref:hypothetical protein n=1 Tax=Streptomyces sp. WMMC897 TaxID=3014782 RepID=UPI0022B749E6|nr:hypothetical protein [Streptomyces sp. WMMC897]MCZ7414271.1 hypothetical protein [Streptomyces sp. WMMC897]